MKTALTLAILICLGFIPFSGTVWLDVLLIALTVAMVVCLLVRNRRHMLLYLMLLTAVPLISFIKWFEPAFVKQATEAAYRNMNNELDLVDSAFNQFFLNNAAALDSIEILVGQYEDITADQYQRWLSQILPAHRNQFLNVALSDELIVQHVYPTTEANIEVKGANLGSVPDQSLQYRHAAQTRQSLVIGPVTLLQGVPGIIYVRPIGDKRHLIVSGVLSLQKLKDDLTVLLSDSVHLQIDVSTLLTDYRLIEDSRFDSARSVNRVLNFGEIQVELSASSNEVDAITQRTHLVTRLSAGLFWLTMSLVLSWQQNNFRLRDTQRQELKKSEGELVRAQRLGKIGSWSSDDGEVLTLSVSLQELLKVTSDEMTLDDFLARLHPDQRERDIQRIRGFLRGHADHINLEHKIKTSERYRWYEHRIARGPDHTITGIVRDIHTLRKRDEQVAKLESFDSLTGAANRDYFSQITMQNIALCERRNANLILILINIDGFRSVNEAHGQSTGDELLKQITARLHNNLRKSDTVARLSGDTFALALVDVGKYQQSVVVVEQILRRLKEPYLIEEDLYPQFTLGVAMYPDDAQDYGTLLQMAESALSAAKSEARGHYRYYSAELSEQTDRRQKILASLPAAIANDRLDIVFQPRVSSSFPHQITSMEVLVRWNDPVLGLVSPGEFIPVAEHTALISDIGYWVMTQAFRKAAEYRRLLPSGITLSINLSPRQLEDRSLPQTVDALLHECGVQASQFELEITEHSIAEQSEDILHNMSELSRMGFRFALDDFGTGYSNLAMLQSLPLNVLKVDMSFIRAIGTTEKSDDLIKAILNMGHTLGLRLVAEGVENSAQVEFLRDQGCEELQGFFFFKPQPIEDLITPLRRSTY